MVNGSAISSCVVMSSVFLSSVMVASFMMRRIMGRKVWRVRECSSVPTVSFAESCGPHLSRRYVEEHFVQRLIRSFSSSSLPLHEKRHLLVAM